MLKRLFKMFTVVICSMAVVWWLNVPILDGQRDQGPNVVVTTPILQDLVMQLLGPEANVQTLIPRAQTHLTASKRDDVAELIKKSDVVVFNGSAMDGPYQDVLAFKQKGVVFININDVISRNRRSDTDYYWMNVLTWTSVSNYIQRRLMAALPKMKSEISYRAMTYQKRLYDLNQRMNKQVNQLKGSWNAVGLNHSSLAPFFNLMRLDYFLVQVPESPTEDDFNKLVDQLKVDKVSRLYPAAKTNESALVDLSKVTFSQGWKLTVLPPLMSLTLDKKGTGIDNYLDMMEYNLRVLAGG